MKRQTLFIFSAFLLLFFSSSVSSQRIWQVINPHPTFQLLRVEIGRKAAPLISTYLNADSNITLFGPTEDAMYDNLPALQPLPAATITEIMNYHIATGALPSSYVASQYVIQSAYAPASMGGRPQRLTVFVNTTDGTTANVFINGIGLVTIPDISASNGIIHGISAVLRPPNVTVMDTLIARQPATFSTLINFLNAQNLQTTFRQDGGVTLFAPTDAAWAQLQQAQPAIYQAIVTDPPTLTKFLKYHAASTLVYAGEAPLGSSSVPSVAGPNLEVVKSNATLTVNGAPVTTTNILCKNGVVHVIDRVLIPPDFVPNLRVILRGQGLTTMISQMDANGLGSILDDLSTNHTVYAPTNAAFTAYTGQVNADLLSYHFSDEYDRTSSFYQGELEPTHYMPGSLLNQSQRLQVSIVNASTTFINNARLVSGDYAAANGIIHILDRVMPLPPTLATIVRSTATFSTLATLLNSTGMLTGALSVTPGLTLFAPTDAAFALVDRQVLRYLTRPLAAPVLANVLSYHVINGATSGNTIFYAMNVPSGINSVTMLSGETASFNKTGSFSISVNAKSNVAKADTLAANGVLHTVDSVMVPPSFVFNLQKALVGADVTDFLALVQNTTELAPLLTGAAGYTIFAPTNAALAALPRPLPTGAALVQLLQYHFVSGVTMRNALVNGTVVPTLLFPAGLGGAAQVLRVNITSNTTILVNGVNITMANNTAVNGVVHVIDKVLMPPADINGTLAGMPSFSIFNSLLAGSGLAELFAGVNRTLFVPDNNAFASLNAFTRQYLMRPSMLPILRDVLRYHLVVSSVLYSANIPMGTTTIAMANDVTVTVMKANNTLTVNGVPVTRPDILVSNGVIHGVSRLLLPPGKYDFSLIPALQAVNATLFLDAIESSGTVGPFLVMQAKRTVFAPSNRAMQAVQVMPTGDALVQLLKYHLVNGSFLASSFSDRQLLFSNLNLTSLRGAAQRLRITIDADTRRMAVNNATLLTFNDLATNGVVHLIDKVLMPPSDILAVAGVLPQNCSTFVQATTFAGLASIFKRSALTSFIPTNQAFRALPKNLLKYLLLGPASAQDLNSFITYHLINQFLLYSPDFPVRGSFPTQQGPPVVLGRITGPTGRPILKVNDANVVVSALASNGVVHVLDEVLVPPTFQFTLDKLLLALDSKLFRAYLTKAKLQEWTISTDPVTFFVPTDNAFLEDTPKLDKLQRNELVQLMANHIVRGKFDSIEPGDRLVTLAGNTLIVSSDENSNTLYVTLEGNVTPQTLAVVIGGTVNPALNGDVYQISHVLQREGNQHLEPGTIASIVLLSLLFAVVIVGFAAYVYKQFKDLNHYTQLG